MKYFFFKLITIFIFAEGQCLQQCRTPQETLGVCISIRSCSSLMKLIAVSRQDPNIANYLKQSGCGFDGFGPKVLILLIN